METLWYPLTEVHLEKMTVKTEIDRILRMSVTNLGYWHQRADGAMATLPKVNQTPLVLKDKSLKPPPPQ